MRSVGVIMTAAVVIIFCIVIWLQFNHSLKRGAVAPADVASSSSSSSNKRKTSPFGMKKHTSQTSHTTQGLELVAPMDSAARDSASEKEKSRAGGGDDRGGGGGRDLETTPDTEPAVAPSAGT